MCAYESWAASLSGLKEGLSAHTTYDVDTSPFLNVHISNSVEIELLQYSNKFLNAI
jgi:hypothetical protein